MRLGHRNFNLPMTTTTISSENERCNYSWTSQRCHQTHAYTIVALFTTPIAHSIDEPKSLYTSLLTHQLIVVTTAFFSSIYVHWDVWRFRKQLINTHFWKGHARHRLDTKFSAFSPKKNIMLMSGVSEPGVCYTWNFNANIYCIKYLKLAIHFDR